MNCFKLPKEICEDIERILAHYWWNTQQQGNTTHWVACDRMKFLKKEGGLGFRDIEKFNEALLAKQAWRILQNPNCLLSRVLRGRYFTGSNILNANRGVQPSFGWQSILLGRDLLWKGLRYTVGDGHHIQTWLDPWLPIHPPRPPRKAPNYRSDDIPTVDNLLLPDKSDWNTHLVRERIHMDDAATILSIKVSIWQHNDYLGWHYTKDGLYTVKSGYWLATHHPELMLDNRPPPGDPLLKKEIWKTKTPPKFKHFLWCLLSNALATGAELDRRHISANDICKRCTIERETTEHLFFSCPHAQEIWRASNIPIRCLLDPVVTVEDKMKEIFKFHKHRRIYDRLSHLPFWILWKLWTSRNKLTFRNLSKSWQRELREAKEETDEWLSSVGIQNSSHTTTVNSNAHRLQNRSWRQPHMDWFKCNYDGSFLDGNRRATGAWLIRDDQGTFKEAGQITGKPVSNALEVELQSLCFAMKQTWLSGYRKVIFEGDSQLLVRNLYETSPRFDIYNWIEEIRGWSTRFEAVEFKWIAREANAPADKLAKAQQSMISEFNLHHTIPVCIQSLLNSVTIPL